MTMPEILQYSAVFFCSLNIITAGLEYGWAAAFLPRLQDVNDVNKLVSLTDSEGSWAAIGILLGSLISFPITGVIVNILGRKTMIQLSFFPYLTSWIAIACTQSPAILIWSRFIGGLSDGICFKAVPIYIGEISNKKVRGMLQSSIPICVITGVITINIMQLFLSFSDAALACIMLPSVSFIGMYFMPESPYYLLKINRKDEAKTNLIRLRGTKDVEDEIARIDEIIEKQSREKKITLKDIFSVSSNRRAMFIALLLRVAQQLSGISALIFYISIIYKESGALFSVHIFTIIFFGIQYVMIISGNTTVDWAGRRVILLCSLFGTALALFVEAVYLQCLQQNTDLSKWSIISTIALIMFVISYNFGLQNVPCLIVKELFPLNVRKMGICLSDICFFILASIVSKYFEFVNTNIGGYVAFYSFGICCMVNFFLVYIFVPETKNLTSLEIQTLLQTGNKFKKPLEEI
ncbi:hypothetical protein WA026_000972 [Henosepilachna vigintioctopunctata]|uniref:Major facilitator superfamily (MFS) profile domain-containing protein n=1 Tax=Henosepilachna vigintioctopunctata TaxID=420089 RepID=A0AAW1V273_9CUCU